MTNIFNFSEQWQALIDDAGNMDAQTLADRLEALGDVTPDKVADMIAAATTIRMDAEKNEIYLEPVLNRIDAMKRNANALEHFALDAVEKIGKPRGDNPAFKEVAIEGRPWIQGVWTELTAPAIEVVDERIIDEQFKVPQPPALDINAIAERWLSLNEQYTEQRGEYIRELKRQVEAGETTDAEAKQALYTFDNHNRPEIEGVNIEQKTGVNYR